MSLIVKALVFYWELRNEARSYRAGRERVCLACGDRWCVLGRAGTPGEMAWPRRQDTGPCPCGESGPRSWAAARRVALGAPAGNWSGGFSGNWAPWTISLIHAGGGGGLVSAEGVQGSQMVTWCGGSPEPLLHRQRRVQEHLIYRERVWWWCGFGFCHLFLHYLFCFLSLSGLAGLALSWYHQCNLYYFVLWNLCLHGCDA